MKKLLYIVTGLVFFMVSCQSDGLYDYSEVRNSEAIGMEGAESRTISAKALDFVSDLRKETRAGTEGLSVSSVYAWRVCDMLPQTRYGLSMLPTDTLLYIVNFTNDNGFALVSALDNYDGVVAYIESGHLTPDDEIDNPGFNFFLESFMAGGGFSPGIPDPTPYDSIPIPGVWHTTAFYAPLLTTQWGQGDPFNRLCYTSDSLQAVAGCGAIAASQIVAYHQHPSAYQTHTYLWNDILSGNTPQTESGKTSVSELVYDVGHLIRTEYGVSASTSYTDSISYCWNEFGYSYSLMDFNIDSCLVDFQNNRPVFMRGTGIIEFPDRIRVFGHAWVIDGCVVREREILTIQPPGSQNEIQHFIHCNWGWDGEYDGYYIAGAFGTKYDQNGENPTTAYPFYNLLLRTYNNIYPLNP